MMTLQRKRSTIPWRGYLRLRMGYLVQNGPKHNRLSSAVLAKQASKKDCTLASRGLKKYSRVYTGSCHTSYVRA